jgi:hypothetical protein
LSQDPRPHNPNSCPMSPYKYFPCASESTCSTHGINIIRVEQHDTFSQTLWGQYFHHEKTG